jgi:hypothetical protein
VSRRKAINAKWNLDKDVIDDINIMAKRFKLYWNNPVHRMWKLNRFAKTEEGKLFRDEIYALKTRFAISLLKNTNRKIWKKLKLKVNWLEWEKAFPFHPRSWKKQFEEEWLIE